MANRLPVQQGDDGWELSPGGLVTALRPVMATRAGAWVGWDGGTRGMPAALPDSDVRLLPVGLSAAQVRDYYRGFANATMWPLLHDYHLMLVPQLIRDRRPDQPIGFFLHVPWPSPDIYARLPWREQICGVCSAPTWSPSTRTSTGATSCAPACAS